MTFQRTLNLHKLDATMVGQMHTIAGWVARIRVHKRTIFLDVRDREDTLQVIFTDPTAPTFRVAQTLHREDVVQVRGQVVARELGAINRSIRTGALEMRAEALEILNRSHDIPFPIDNGAPADEKLRLSHRYLDLRCGRMQRNLRFRARMIQTIRHYLEHEDFIEVETPILANATPEGARDFLVPSRLQPGQFFALPQSPQQFKQLLMVGGVDRYYQIAHCFRDEDSRGDRQPEFTQLDIEMAFVEVDDVIHLISGLVKYLFESLGINYSVSWPIPCLTYSETMRRFGSDKPDTRFGLELQDVPLDLAPPSGPPPFPGAGGRGRVVAIHIPRELPTLPTLIMPYSHDRAQFEIVSAQSTVQPWQQALLNAYQVQREEALLVGTSVNWSWVSSRMGELRLKIADELNLRDPHVFDLLWVTDFPLLEWKEVFGRWDAVHHPFTSPRPEDILLLDSDPGGVRAQSYDLVMQGTEIGGGSIRIHLRDVQEKVFHLLGINQETARRRFGHILQAFDYGTPPHGGIALGLDRIAMHLLGEPSIREVIAFPKTSTGVDLMTGAPSAVDEQQLRELHIRHDDLSDTPIFSVNA